MGCENISVVPCNKNVTLVEDKDLLIIYVQMNDVKIGQSMGYLIVSTVQK